MTVCIDVYEGVYPSQKSVVKDDECYLIETGEFDDYAICFHRYDDFTVPTTLEFMKAYDFDKRSTIAHPSNHLFTDVLQLLIETRVKELVDFSRLFIDQYCYDFDHRQCRYLYKVFNENRPLFDDADEYELRLYRSLTHAFYLASSEGCVLHIS